MSAFTPGPWLAREYGTGKQTPCYELIGDADAGPDEVYLAEFDGATEADRRLIAAAPELVDVLRVMANSHRRNDGATGQCHCMAHEDARALLARIDGED